MHVKKVNMKPTARQNLYQLSEPLEGHDFVIISYNSDMWSNETYVFGADSFGNVEDWGELSASKGGEYSDVEILEEAGYRILTEVKQ